MMTLPDGRTVEEKLYRERFTYTLARGYRPCDNPVPCRFCFRPSQPTRVLGEATCDGCWEVVHRFDSFLSEGGAAALEFVKDALKCQGEAGR